MKAHVQILKFGGTSVGNGERIRRVAQIIAHTFNNPAEAFPVVVVSAMSKVTDQLLRIAGYAYAGEQEAYASELEALKQKHLDAAEKAVYNRDRRNALQEELHAAFILLERDIEKVVAAAHPESDHCHPFASLRAGSECNHCHPECNEGSPPTLSLPF